MGEMLKTATLVFTFVLGGEENHTWHKDGLKHHHGRRRRGERWESGNEMLSNKGDANRPTGRLRCLILTPHLQADTRNVNY